jgi:hypothetical protein
MFCFEDMAIENQESVVQLMRLPAVVAAGHEVLGKQRLNHVLKRPQHDIHSTFW